MRVTRPVRWFGFRGPRGKRWSVWISTHRISRELNDKDGPLYGVACFIPRRIYINAAMPRREFLRTVAHEITHVTHEPLRLNPRLDEDIVNRSSKHLASILEQLGMKWPAIKDWECQTKRLTSKKPRSRSATAKTSKRPRKISRGATVGG